VTPAGSHKKAFRIFSEGFFNAKLESIRTAQSEEISGWAALVVKTHALMAG